MDARRQFTGWDSPKSGTLNYFPALILIGNLYVS